MNTACQSQCRYARLLQPGQCCMEVDPVTSLARGVVSENETLVPANQQGCHQAAFLRLARAM